MSEASLYDRLGGGDKLKTIVADIWANHISNPKIKNRYVNSDGEKVKQVVWEFFCSGIGGPQEYTGQDMLAPGMRRSSGGSHYGDPWTEGFGSQKL